MDQRELAHNCARLRELDLPNRLHQYFEALGESAFDFTGQPAIQDQFGAALAYKYITGCSVFPTRCDDPKKLKTPAIEWAQLRETVLSDDEIKDHWTGKTRGIGIVCGAGSGNLEVLDFEAESVYFKFKEKVVAEKGETFWKRFYIVRTPRPGRHIYYRCAEGVDAGAKLAFRPIDGQDDPELVIETRGEGHYVLGVGSPGCAHPTGRRYVTEQLTPEDIPTITAEDRLYLLDAARSFDLSPPGSKPCPKSKPVIPTRSQQESQGRPGDDFNERATWPDILLPHGWSFSHERDGVTYWTRPGKDPSEGHSATTGHGGDYLYVFSSSVTAFEQDRGYSKFTVYAIINHQGDFSTAAKDLWNKGYGSRAEPLIWNDIPDGNDHADIAAKPDEEKEKPPSAAAQRNYLLALAEGECDLFKDQFGTPTATVRAEWRTLALHAPEFLGWLDRKFKQLSGRYPSPDVTTSVVETLSRQAQSQPAENVYTRYATVEVDGEKTIYVNLMDGMNFVEITRKGVRVTKRPNARMKAGGGTSLPLPLPDLNAKKEDLLDLKRVVNVKDDDDLFLILGYLAGCITSTGPFLILAISGEQGSAKSTALEIVRHILDPDNIEHAEMPDNILDLRAVVKAHTVLCLDNVSKLSRQDSDRLCRIATGGGIVSRSLYTNDELSALKVCRPILLNSIPTVAEHGDLSDRCISVSLPTLAAQPGMRKRKDKVVMPQFREMLPRILGALYKAASASLDENYECKSNVRMIEFVERVGAAEPALPWEARKFEKLVAANRDGSLEDAAENDPIAAAVIAFAKKHPEGDPWEGTWGLLLAEVRQRCTRAPDTERGLQSVVARAAPLLRARNVVVEKTGREKGITKIHAYCRQQETSASDSADELEAQHVARASSSAAPPACADLDFDEFEKFFVDGGNK